MPGFLWIILFFSTAGLAQAEPSLSQAFPRHSIPSTLNDQPASSSVSPTTGSSDIRRDYLIGPEDLLEISVFEVPELSRSVRVSASGEISLPLMGTTRAAGLTPAELENSLTDILRKSY